MSNTDEADDIIQFITSHTDQYGYISEPNRKTAREMLGVLYLSGYQAGTDMMQAVSDALEVSDGLLGNNSSDSKELPI